MVLSDKEIRTLSQNNDMALIAPFHEDQLQSASYDVQLSGKVSSFKRRVQTIDLTQTAQSDIDRLYEEHTMDSTGYIIQPGEFVLVQLKEKLQLPSDMVAHLRPRTRLTRIGLIVSAQHCNPTYAGVLYVGLFNASPNALRINEGLPIAQVVFETLSQKPSSEKLYVNKSNAAYMNESDFRGSVLSEKGWSKAAQEMYQDIISSLER